MNKRVLFIGGSPCSGKSTVAERLSKEYGAYYFKVDDYLDKFTNIAAGKGYPTCKKSVTMTSDEIWMREPLIQCEENVVPCIVNDGLRTQDEMFSIVKELFNLT